MIKVAVFTIMHAFRLSSFVYSYFEYGDCLYFVIPDMFNSYLYYTMSF